MTKEEQYISEMRAMATPANKAIVEGIIKGFAEIMIDSYKQHGMDPDAYAKLESHRVASNMSTRAFVESIGNEIMASKYSDDTKKKLMENLGKYANTL